MPNLTNMDFNIIQIPTGDLHLIDALNATCPNKEYHQIKPIDLEDGLNHFVNADILDDPTLSHYHSLLSSYPIGVLTVPDPVF